MNVTIYRHQADRNLFSVVGAGVTGSLAYCMSWVNRWVGPAIIELVDA